MTARINNQRAWLLHHRPFRDSSMIIDFFSHDYGLVTLIARGSRSQKSKLKGILRPFLPLDISWIKKTDLGTLTGAELNGDPIALKGEALLSAYYINELMLNLLHRDDSQVEMFSTYTSTIKNLCAFNYNLAILRVFEIRMLELLGYGLNFQYEAKTGKEIEKEMFYQYIIDEGPVFSKSNNGPMIFSGEELIAIGSHDFSNPLTLKNAGRLLRPIITNRIGGKELKSRKVLKGMRKVMSVNIEGVS